MWYVRKLNPDNFYNPLWSEEGKGKRFQPPKEKIILFLSLKKEISSPNSELFFVILSE